MIKTWVATLTTILALSTFTFAQTTKAPQRICIEVSHQPKFWNDPETMEKKYPEFVDRVRYMTGEFEKSAKSVNAMVSYLKSEITPMSLTTCDLVFIHTPSSKYSPSEITALIQYINKGGSLFLVMDEDYWSTLEQTDANELVRPFGIKFGGKSFLLFRI